MCTVCPTSLRYFGPYLRHPIDYNITGTSSGAEKQQVVDIVCSQECKNITAAGTKLTPPIGAPSYTCSNVVSAAQLDFPCSTS
jgi:galacturan 1,4-alpha-galacturonidase